jgi:AcrR family transcriptional regulator
MEEEWLLDDLMKKFWDEVKDEDELSDKQKKIMEASIKLFSEKGFHAASTSEIAKEAGVAEGTIYRYFKTKKDILISLVAPMVLRFAAPYLLKDVKTILQEDLPIEDALKKLYKNRLTIVEKNWARLRLIIQEVQFHPELREALVDNLVSYARNMTEAFVAQKISEGEFRPLPPFAVTRAIVTMMVGYLFFKHIIYPDEGKTYNDDQEIALMVDILLHGVGAQR